MSATTGDGRPGELRRFLRAMRARLDPRDVGLPQLKGRRRFSGLRVEEAAILADVGLTWYSALESGKDIRVSAKLLDRVATALRMKPEEREQLFALAFPQIRHETQATDTAHLEAVIDGFAIGPAFICDRFWNVGACNRLANLVYGHDRSHEKNLLARLVLEPDFRALHEHWEPVARQMVSILHLAFGRAPNNVAAIALIERLNAASSEFAAWWTAYDLGDYAPKAGTIIHPELGRLDLLFTSFVASTLTAREEPSMVLLQPPLNDATRERLATAV